MISLTQMETENKKTVWVERDSFMPVAAVGIALIGGAAALFAVNIAGLATGIQLSVNRWSLGAGALLGVPGVISMLVLNIVFK